MKDLYLCEMEYSKSISKNWRIVESITILAAIAYFTAYPRMAASDFVFCSVFTLLLFLCRKPMGLKPPTLRKWGVGDWLLMILSIGLMLGFWIYGYTRGRLNTETGINGILIVLTYFYYGFIQHFLAQRYISVRMSQLTNGHVLKAAILTGLAFGFLHIRELHLIIPSTIGGALFSYYYLSTGRLWMVVFAHATISSNLIYWFFERNPFRSIVALWA